MTTRPTIVRMLGKGPGLPLMPDPRSSRIVYAEGPEKVRQSIMIILETEPGERLMRPTFGTGLCHYLMKPNTAATRALIQNDVQRAITLWEPRIKLQEVRVEPGTDPALVEIQIAYVHVRDGSPGNLVYPFYLE